LQEVQNNVGKKRDFSFMGLYDKRIILKGEEDIN
jgi:hypothetical protein